MAWTVLGPGRSSGPSRRRCKPARHAGRAYSSICSDLSTLGTIISTFVIGALFWCAAYLLGYELRFIFALLFGALISPTDPIAVLGILKKAGAPKDQETRITG
ncbi:cation:proton antiporter [Burkholderia sp. L27(2015)]|uniref:cation:proton antiporter domain-containing protein n=1 Tax=Burkholderia sp. L27(2015) TaxID=1641858 RepID=UPI001C208883|nr:cation:proton antiporter [Burkholderia sp. L27(2015)]